MSDIVVISGANGAGKSTLAPYLLRDTFGILEYVNADTIAQGLSAFSPERFAIEAGRLMLRQLKLLALQKKDFAFETTLASKFYGKWLKGLQQRSYEFHLVFLYLQSAELAIERVRERVRIGGHNIPEDVIHGRYKNGLRNFFEIYQPIANSWRFYDVSGDNPVLVAYKAEKELQISKKDLWNQISKKIKEM